MTNRDHNNPPDPIDEAIAPFADYIAEAELWLDGSPVENEDQMRAVDGLTRQIKAAKKAVEAAEESEAKPVYDQWKAAKARFKPTLGDLDRIVKGLVAAVDGFKRNLSAQKEAASKEAERLAWAAAAEAREAAMSADPSDIEAQRNVAKKRAEADAARRLASEAIRDAIRLTGLRVVYRYEVVDHRALLNWIAINARDDLTAFVDEWARSHHNAFPQADGLRVWSEKESF